MSSNALDILFILCSNIQFKYICLHVHSTYVTAFNLDIFAWMYMNLFEYEVKQQYSDTHMYICAPKSRMLNSEVYICTHEVAGVSVAGCFRVGVISGSGSETSFVMGTSYGTGSNEKDNIRGGRADHQDIAEFEKGLLMY